MSWYGWVFGGLVTGVLSLAPWARDWPFRRDVLTTPTSSPPMPREGVAFEHWCADQLRARGWHCAMTRRSGDDGVDLVANQRGVRVGIQVKSWNRPVTKKAVQEAAAGRPMYRCTHAAVISRSGYMPSVAPLARANGVMLLHATDLEALEAWLPPAQPSRRQQLLQRVLRLVTPAERHADP